MGFSLRAQGSVEKVLNLQKRSENHSLKRCFFGDRRFACEEFPPFLSLRGVSFVILTRKVFPDLAGFLSCRNA